jgi:hypothetical protein
VQTCMLLVVFRRGFASESIVSSESPTHGVITGRGPLVPLRRASAQQHIVVVVLIDFAVRTAVWHMAGLGVPPAETECNLKEHRR